MQLLTQKENEQFRKQGYLLLKTVISPTRIAALLAETKRLVAEASGKRAVLREAYYHENSYKLTRVLRQTAAFDDLIDHPAYFGKLVGLIGAHLQLMGCEIFVRGTAAQSITGFHTDLGAGLQQVLPDDHNAFLQIKVQLFLTDLSQPDSSNFVLIPGSHRWPVPDRNPLCMIDSLNVSVEREGRLPTGAMQVLAQPGDVLLFPHTLWHAVAPNRAGRTRYSIALRYGQTALRPMERFDGVLTDPLRVLSPRQRRLLGDLGRADASPYRPPEQDALIGVAGPARAQR